LVRPFGIVAYGFTPLLATPEEVATAHGDDERVREDTMRQSVAVLYDVVSELCRHRN
jgi:acetylornithine deacetylase/succinyl-diaminopimelate desuccinylase-like protein